jgi:hypothetical protein
MLFLLEWRWLGVFIAPNHQTTVGAGCCRWAHRTVRCASHVTQPLGFGRSRLLELCLLVAPDRYCSLFSVPLTIVLLYRALFVHCSSVSLAFAVDRCVKELLLRWFTGKSGGTPDSPVNYSRALPEKPEGGEFGVVRSWCTGHCPVAHRTVRCARPGHPWFLCSFDFEP